MKPHFERKKKVWIDQFQHVRHFETHEESTRKPLSDQRGIQCKGDRLGYVVEWQVDDKRSTH